MTGKDIFARLSELDDLYFNLGESPVTDTEYDLLRAEAKAKDPNHPYWSKVGHTIDAKFEKIKLEFTMGGLDEVNPETVYDWIIKEDGDIIASEKLDGNSIGSSWIGAKLSYAASRGNGEEGQNLLQKVKHIIPNVPCFEIYHTSQGPTQKVSLRGEALLKGDLFKDLGFKNRRNSVTGLLRRDEVNVDDLKKLSVIFYELVNAPAGFHDLSTEEKRLLYIKNVLGLPIVKYIRISAKDAKNKDLVVKILQEYLETLKEEADYDIDGLVLTRDNSVRENAMHVKNKVKFKVNQSAIKCKVVAIEWSVTRLGYIKPVIIIEPVDILGVTVTRCSGFNYNFINASQIGIGSEIGVVRSGDVIPYVTEVYKTAKPNIPTTCPCCKSTLQFTYDDIGHKVDLICVNENCNEKSIYNVSHFFTTMGVEGLSDKTFENIGITSIPEVYKVTSKYLEKLPGIGEKKAEIIVNEVKKTLLNKPEKVLAAFGIPLIGKTLSKQLCNQFTLDELFEIKDPKVLGLGEITSKTLIENIGKYKKLYEFLKSIGLQFIQEDESLKTLNGLKFALTGEGPMKRSEIQKKIESLGGTVGGISKDTDYLVTNDPESNSGKMKSAVKFGTKVISYKTLFEDYLE